MYIFLEYVCSRSRFIPPADCYCLHTTARPLQPTERRGATLSANKMGIIIIVTMINGEFSDGDPFWKVKERVMLPHLPLYGKSVKLKESTKRVVPKPMFWLEIILFYHHHCDHGSWPIIMLIIAIIRGSLVCRQ